MTTTAPAAATQPQPAAGSHSGEHNMTPPPKLRRRPLLWAIGIALMALGGLLAAYIATAVSDTESVIALRNDVDRGTVITADDLAVVQVSVDPTLDPVAGAQREAVIGQRAARDLNAGSLLTSDSYAEEVIPAEGETLVGVALKPGQLPATGVRAGESVRVINTPREQDNVPKTDLLSLSATVVDVTTDANSGMVVVDVVIPTEDSAQLASMVATGRVGLVVDPAAEAGGN